MSQSTAARPAHASGGEASRSRSRPRSRSAQKSKNEPFSLRISAPAFVP
jgi:hypothetical protein